MLDPTPRTIPGQLCVGCGRSPQEFHAAACPEVATFPAPAGPDDHLGVEPGGVRTPAGWKETNPKDALGARKLPLHLVPAPTLAFLALGHGNGALKYGGWNFRATGVRASVYIAAALRHLEAWNDGEETDPDDGVPNLAGALTCLSIIVDAQAKGVLLDDRPPRGGYVALREKLTRIYNALQDRAATKPTAPRHYTIADSEEPAGGNAA